MNKRLHKLLATITLASLCAFATQAQDEAAPVAKPAPAAETEAPTELPALEIEGRVFGENSAYAGTYSLIDSEAIELSNIQDVEDLSGAVPGLHVTDTNGRSFANVYTLRGIGNTPLFGTSGIVFYLDDVPQGDPSSINSVLTDLDSIRVYRGPQGHLFGRNSSAGVVSMYSRKPGDARETEVDLTFGEYNTREYSIFTGAPLDNGMSYSFSLGHSEREGYIYNSALSKYEDDRDHTGGRFNLYFKANDVIDVNIGISVDKFDDGAQGFINITDLDAATGQVSRNNKYFISQSDDGSIKIDRDQEWLKLTRNFDWGTLTSITSRLNWDLYNVQDLDFTGISLAKSTIDQTQDTWTQEFRFETNAEGPLAWKGGLFYLNTDIEGAGRRQFLDTTITMDLTTFATTQTPNGFEDQTTSHTFSEENVAVFGSFEYEYTEQANVFGGIRWDRTEKTINRTKTSVLAAATDPAPFAESKTFTQVTPSVGLTYGATETTKWFAKSSLGYKSGGFSAYTDNLTELAYDEEKAWTNEIGVNLQSNGTWRMVITAFWSEIEGYQFEKLSTMTNYGIINADEVRGRGAEVEFVAQPAERLLLSAAFGINDMTFEKHDGYTIGSGIVSYNSPTEGVLGKLSTPTDYSGKRVPFAPRYTLNLAAQYTTPAGYYGRVELRRVGDTYYDEENSANLHQENYSVVNASIGFERDDYSIQVFGRNLGDEQYYSNIAPIDKDYGMIGGMSGSPRIFGVSLSKKF